MRDGFFTQEFLQAIPNDNLEALVYLYREFSRFRLLVEETFRNSGGRIVREQSHNDFVETLAVFRAFFDARNLKSELPTVGPNKTENVANIINSLAVIGAGWESELSKRTSNSLFTEKKEFYSAVFNSVQIYEFTDVDLKRIQELTNELRDLISASQLITADHKRRLLRRLEALQREIHKNTSDIDRFWGFIAEAGIVARKFGEDLKPITDKATELGKIIITVVMAKEGVKALPDITKLLGN